METTHFYEVEGLNDLINAVFGAKEKITHENLDFNVGKAKNQQSEREYATSDEQLLETAAKYEELAKGLRQKVEDRHKKPLKAQLDADPVKIYKMGETFLVIPRRYVADYELFLKENGITPIVYAGSLLTDLTLTRE